RNGRGQRLQQLLQIQLGSRIRLVQLLLKNGNLRFIVPHFAEAGQQPDSLDDLFFLQRNSPTAVSNGAARSATSSTRGTGSAPTASSHRYASQGHHRHAVARNTTARAFRCSNQLQEFLRIIQPLL